MAEEKKPFDMFTNFDNVNVSRLGKKIMIVGRDGTYSDSDSVEANLLFEILKTLKKK